MVTMMPLIDIPGYQQGRCVREARKTLFFPNSSHEIKDVCGVDQDNNLKSLSGAKHKENRQNYRRDTELASSNANKPCRVPVCRTSRTDGLSFNIWRN